MRICVANNSILKTKLSSSKYSKYEARFLFLLSFQFKRTILVGLILFNQFNSFCLVFSFFILLVG